MYMTKTVFSPQTEPRYTEGKPSEGRCSFMGNFVAVP
jgi:hypothetical protein